MTPAIKQVVIDTGLCKQGITPNDVYSHSLRAGGAMALKLNGISDTTIKKAGRWTSMAFLQYIHNQIGHLSAGLSQAMKKSALSQYRWNATLENRGHIKASIRIQFLFYKLIT